MTLEHLWKRQRKSCWMRVREVGDKRVKESIRAHLKVHLFKQKVLGVVDRVSLPAHAREF